MIDTETELFKVPDDVLLKQSRQEVGELHAYIDELKYDIEQLQKKLKAISRLDQANIQILRETAYVKKLTDEIQSLKAKNKDLLETRDNLIYRISTYERKNKI